MICGQENNGGGGGGGGGGGPNMMGTFVILTDEAGVKHPGWIFDWNDTYPTWATVYVVNVKVEIVGDLEVAVPNLTTKSVVAESSATPAPGRTSWWPVVVKEPV